MVEELFPASVSVVVKMDVNGGVAARFFGFSDKGHTSLYRGTASFFYIAAGAGTDDVFP